MYDKTDQIDTIKAAPPALVSLAHIIGWSIADWVQFVTLIYLIVILSHKLWAWTKEIKSKK
jgi:hypothetical protein